MIFTLSFILNLVGNFNPEDGHHFKLKQVFSRQLVNKKFSEWEIHSQELFKRYENGKVMRHDSISEQTPGLGDWPFPTMRETEFFLPNGNIRSRQLFYGAQIRPHFETEDIYDESQELLIEVTSKYENGDSSKTTFVHDSKGRIIEWQTTSTIDGAIAQESKGSAIYDDENRQRITSSCLGYGEGLTLGDRAVESYDDEGNVFDYKCFSGERLLSSWKISGAPDQGTREETTEYRKDGSVYSYSLEIFDALGNRVLSTSEDPDNGKKHYEWKHDYQFNERKQLVSHTKFEEGSAPIVTTYTYDDSGRLVESLIQDQGQWEQKTVYSY